MSNRFSTQSRRFALFVTAGVITAMVAALLIWSFVVSRGEADAQARRESPVQAPSLVSTQNDATVITLDAKTQQRNGIETATLASAPFQPEIRAYASVLDVTQSSGLGDSLVSLRMQLRTARAKAEASKAALDRARKLYGNHQDVSLAQLQAAEATWRTDQAALAALETIALQQWGPVLGKSINDGSALIENLIARRDLLLQVTLPTGNDLSAPPATAYIQIDKTSRAPIALVSAATRTDPKIQGVSFLYLVPAHSDVLLGMNVLALLPSGSAIKGQIVPASAIVWWQDRAWAYRRTAANTFTRIEILTDRPALGGGFVVTTLPNGAQIVTRGAQLLLSEEFRAQIQGGGGSD
ncbi:MAG: multidrug transporter [Gammaproteobacteria bacterium]|nr:multidrug transporter [Gammaproteobacteria bacterium]